jgi:hypothetical protein
MFKENQTIYYLDESFIIQKGIYKGEVYSLPYKSITNILSKDEENILINSDCVFETEQDIIEYLDCFKE